MWYWNRTYILREEVAEDGTRYFISFKDRQGIFYELNVSYDFYMGFRRWELDNRKLETWDWRHREFSEIHEKTLNRRALRLPEAVDELIIEEEQAELLRKAIAVLPEIQRGRFLLYYEYEYNYYEIAAMEHCTASSVGQSITYENS